MVSPPTPLTGVARLNTMPADELASAFGRCLAVPSWVAALAAGRPYAEPADLLALADEVTANLSDAEVRTALADHPRIGERAAKDSATADLSRAEQSGVDDADDGLAARLRAANVEYEQRFGHIYLVCASGRRGEEILADLRARMSNDPETEISVVRRELAGIARLRLATVLAG